MSKTKEKAPEPRRIPLSLLRMRESTEFWGGRFATIWNTAIFPRTECYYNVDLRLVVMKAPGKPDTLISEGVMLMVPAE